MREIDLVDNPVEPFFLANEEFFWFFFVFVVVVVVKLVDHFNINFFFFMQNTSKIRNPFILSATDRYSFFDHFQVIFGLPPPFWLIDSFRAVVGQRQAELAVQRGQLFSPEQALAIGLVLNITIHPLPTFDNRHKLVEAKISYGELV